MCCERWKSYRIWKKAARIHADGQRRKYLLDGVRRYPGLQCCPPDQPLTDDTTTRPEETTAQLSEAAGYIPPLSTSRRGRPGTIAGGFRRLGAMNIFYARMGPPSSPTRHALSAITELTATSGGA